MPTPSVKKIQGPKLSPLGKKPVFEASLNQRKLQVQKADEYLSNFKEELEERKIARKKAVEVGRMMIAPGKAKLVRAPVFSAAKGATRRFTRTFTIAPGTPSNFGIRVDPGIRDFISYSSFDGTITLPSTDLQVFARLGNMGGIAEFSNYGTSEAYLRQVIKPDNTGFLNVPWGSTRTTGYASATCYNPNKVPVQLEFYTLGVVSSSSKQTTTVPANTTVSLSTPVPGGGGAAAGMSFRFQPVNEDLEFTIRDNLASTLPRTSVSTALIADEWLTAGDIARYRVSACSVLATYRGNMLEGAGMIAAVRTSKTWIPQHSTLYESICKIPDDRYKGPLHEGAYVWWMPYDLQELDFRNVGTVLNEGNALYIGGQIDDAQGALEVTVDMVVDFYSPLQIFERKIFPPMSDVHQQMFFYLSSLDSASCNPSHLEILSKLAKQAVSKAGSFASWLAKNPQYTKLLLEGLATLA